ncbi:MAG: DUF1015 domain-containing protein [Flavobacteriales bacterium]|nr:DUF1015 domain-containing protein [Flavobacteriales bacterium]MDG1767328.1 DUF1015 domain-containing protein [Flavobacteriales bacterium]
MATVRPFKAVRPVKDKVHLVASRSYVSYPPAQLKAKLDENPFTFIHIINPDHDLPNPAAKASIELFRRIGHRFNEFCDEGIFMRDSKPSMYLYKQERSNSSSLGFIAAIAVDDYDNGTIKIHEQTIERREKLFAQYLDTTSFNAEPVLLCHQNDDELDRLSRLIMVDLPEYDYSTTDRVRHQLWPVNDPEILSKIEGIYDEMDALYIADGHHRSASSSLMARNRNEGKKVDPQQAHNYFMAYLIPASSLNIHGFHRMMKDTNGLNKESLLAKLAAHGDLHQIDQAGEQQRKGMFDFYIDGFWYRLDAASNIAPHMPDTQWLTEALLGPIWNIQDLRTDERIRFRPGSSSAYDLSLEVDRGAFACAIYMHPVSFSELKHVSDVGGTMPPKSTWIEPKLRSGLTIFTFDEEERITE